MFFQCFAHDQLGNKAAQFILLTLAAGGGPGDELVSVNMAGQADKKRVKNAAETIVYYQGAVAIATLLYLLALACLDPGVTQVGFWTLVEAAFFFGVTYLTYSGIEIGLNMGTDYSTYQDIFIINTFV